jgi:hypothetical protein
LVSARQLGYAGAFAATAEGVEGTAANAAAPAVRESHSHTWLDYDATAGLSFPGAYGGTDFSNAGKRDERVNHFWLVNAGGQLQIGAWGMSLTGHVLQHELAGLGGTADLRLRYALVNGLVARAFAEGQIVVGAGVRGVVMDASQGPGTLITMTGIGPQVGLVVRPDWERWRIGATLRAPVSGAPFGQGAASPGAAGRLVTPSSVVQPWELELGVAIQLGPRPLNPPWLNPHDQEAPTRERVEAARASRAARDGGAARSGDDDAQRRAEEVELREARERALALRKERARGWPRERVLLLASALVTGASEEAVALEGLLDQRRELVGRSATVSPRVGMESEPIVHRLVLRIGSYLEPSRFAGGSIRQHFTLGADVRLFEWDLFGLVPDASWRVTVAGDFAPRYQNLGLAAGLWH